MINENACSSQPCLNGGSCLTMEGDYYVCLCSTDYVGIDCSTPKGNLTIFLTNNFLELQLQHSELVALLLMLQ